VRLRARPHTLYLGEGRTVLVTDRDGFVLENTNQGLFVHETRLISRLVYRIDGRAPEPVALSNVETRSWCGYYIQLAPGTAERLDTGSGQVPSAAQDALELRLSRYVGEGLHEDVDLTNYGRRRTRFDLSLEVDADFADVLEAGRTRRQKGRRRARWTDTRTLSFDYRAESRRPGRPRRRIERGVDVRLSRQPSSVTSRPRRLHFAIDLKPHQTWHLCLDFVARIDGEELPVRHRCRAFADAPPWPTEPPATRVEGPASATLESVVTGALGQARRDLASLRLHDLDVEAGGWLPAAGLPLFVALYGRDVLTAGWQAALLGPEMMIGALARLAATQGRRHDEWRDEEPGRMLHEAHTGPLSALEIVPHGRSYGSITSSSFYAFVVSQLWHWTGDRAQVAPFLNPAVEALRWMDRHHRTALGFYAYATRSADGVRNQGWKDSADAIVDHRGRAVVPPLATCEEQGFAYVAKIFLADILASFDRHAEAGTLREEAAALKRRFNDVFWMPDEGFLAMAVDGHDRPVRAIGSNAGHCIASGIVDDVHVPAIAARLMGPDLFSGWGVRTLSSSNPAYNPYSYHRGSVWPVEQGSFALAFTRYGLHEHAETLARAVFECAALFDFYRLPEVLAGHPRDDDHPFPAIYPGANSPQAWSSSTLFLLLQALLGLYPYAPLNALVVDPHLPVWLPELTLRDLRVGSACADLRFKRQADGRTSFEVDRREGSLHVVHQPSPWSLTSGLFERLRDLMGSVV
jgi:glycogen debranching enzyme